MNRAFLLLAFLSMGGCAIQDVGFLAADVTQTEGATIIDVYNVGGYLRTRPDDAGLTLGATRRSYVFARDHDGDGSGNELREGWHFFSIPLPDVTAVALDSRAIGIDFRAGAPSLALTIGLTADTLLARVPQDRSFVMRLSYIPTEPSLTQLEICNEDRQCWQIE